MDVHALSWRFSGLLTSICPHLILILFFPPLARGNVRLQTDNKANAIKNSISAQDRGLM